MAIFPLAPDQTIAQMWSMELEGAGQPMHQLDDTTACPIVPCAPPTPLCKSSVTMDTNGRYFTTSAGLVFAHSLHTFEMACRRRCGEVFMRLPARDAEMMS